MRKACYVVFIFLFFCVDYGKHTQFCYHFLCELKTEQHLLIAFSVMDYTTFAHSEKNHTHVLNVSLFPRFCHSFL